MEGTEIPFSQRVTVIARTQLEGFHKWPGAPTELVYLRSLHRHMFHITAEVSIHHNDREIEIITLKHLIERWWTCLMHPGLDTSTWSCERLASELLKWLHEEYPGARWCSVEVSEDGENGAKACQQFYA